MKVQTLSLVIGTRACNAKCAFCVSHITGLASCRKLGFQRYRQSSGFSTEGGATTALLTGKESPLYPAQIDALFHLKKFPANRTTDQRTHFWFAFLLRREGSRPVGRC